MKYLFLLLFTGCASFVPPNFDICIKDYPGHEHCAYAIEGSDFSIDDIGTNYTLYGENLTADQYDAVALRLSPGAYAVLKKSFLNYCHANPKQCVYNDMVERFDKIERELNIMAR